MFHSSSFGPALFTRSLNAYWLTALVLAGCSTTDPARQSHSALKQNVPSAEESGALSVPTAKHQPAPQTNPFVGAEFFLDQRYVDNVLSTVKLAPDKKELLEKAARYPTGLWLDRIAALKALPGWLDEATAQQTKVGKPVVPVIVVYDLPNRDCSAKASSGELKAEAKGEQRYRREFIDPIAAEFAKRPDERVAVILEPDSLANMATNMDVPKCAASADLYKRSVAYAISKLSMPHVYLYVDAAHAGWLGWPANLEAISQIFGEVLDMAGGAERVRGFATNVSNYNALDGQWGWKLETSNPCPNEYCYVEKLDETLRATGITGKGYIVDTSRNGVAETRSRWGHWCNIKGAGLGARPEVAPRPLLDAYFWVKPPGDSDGVSDPSAPRFDEYCASTDSAADAPQAGHWFASYFLQLAENANPPL